MATSLDLFTLRPSSPLRPPAWRWHLPELLRTVPPDFGGPDPYPDEPARKAGKFQALNAHPQAAERLRLLRVMPDEADAYAFWLSATASAGTPVPDGGTPLLSTEQIAQAELEALILAGKSPEKIARVTGLSPAAVRCYEDWFFDVRDRLARPGWVAARVIGQLHQGTVAMLLPALVRAYGYYTRSARLVRAVVSTFDAAGARAAAKDPARFFASDAAAAGSLKAALAVRLLPLNAKTYARVVELHHEALDLDTKSKLLGATQGEDKYREAVATLAAQLSHEHGVPPVEALEGGPLKILSSDAG